jgi:hypothetical protein
LLLELIVATVSLLSSVTSSNSKGLAREALLSLFTIEREASDRSLDE